MIKHYTLIFFLTLIFNGCSQKLLCSQAISKYENLNEKCQNCGEKNESCESTCFSLSKLYYNQTLDSFTEVANTFEKAHPKIDSLYIIQDSLLVTPDFSMAISKANSCISCYGKESLNEEKFAIYVMAYFFSKKHYQESFKLINEFLSMYPNSNYNNSMELMLIGTYTNLAKYSDAFNLLDTYERQPENAKFVSITKRMREIILGCQKYRK